VVIDEYYCEVVLTGSDSVAHSSVSNRGVNISVTIYDNVQIIMSGYVVTEFIEGGAGVAAVPVSWLVLVEGQLKC